MDNKQSSTPGGKSQGFVQQNRNPLIIAAIVIILLVIYFATRGNTETGQQNQNSNQEMSDQLNSNTDNNKESDQGNKPSEGSAMTDTSKPAPAASGEAMSGNLTVTGKLSTTDNPTKGNFMVQSDKGMVYVNTKRDFSSLVGQNVTLSADGTMTAFTLMDIKAAGDVQGASTDTTAKGGPTETPAPPATKPEETGEVKFSGKLDKSTDTAKGTYTITSGKTVVYLQSSRDYSAWVGSDVDLMAKGTIKEFSGATLAKK